MGSINLAVSVADNKNAELNTLTGLVTAAQFLVAQRQAIVTSLQAKSAQFANYLAQATEDQASALANLKLAKDANASVSSLTDSLATAASQTNLAAQGAGNVAADMATLVGKLIFSVDFINKVAVLVNKQKSSNQLVPDSLITAISRANTAANTAVARTLTALQSSYVAQATLLESSLVTGLASTQATTLSETMQVGWNSQDDLPVSGATDAGILNLVALAYATAMGIYQRALWNNTSVARQLSFAKAQLGTATVELASYKAGLAAATAAAYAA
jgi:hypothetical protein